MNDFVNITDSITLEAVGGRVLMNATENAPNDKAIVTEGSAGNSVTITGFDFQNATVADGNGAGIRYEGGNLTVNDDSFENNQNGIMGSPMVTGTGTLTIENSQFIGNGSGSGNTHNLYAGDMAQLTVKNSYFGGANVGHQIKSRALNNTITNNRIIDNSSTTSYEIDIPQGGNTTITGNVIQQGANSQNPIIISYAEEGSAYGFNSGNQLTVSGNTIVNDLPSPSAMAVVNDGSGTATVSGNSVYGLTSGQITRGAANVSGTASLASQPALDTAAPWADSQGGTTTPTPTTGNQGGTTTPMPTTGNQGGTTTPTPTTGNQGGTTTPMPTTGNQGGTTTPTPTTGNQGGTTTPTPTTGNQGGATTPTPTTGNQGGTTTPTPTTGNQGGTTTPTPTTGNQGGTTTPTPTAGDDTMVLQFSGTQAGGAGPQFLASVDGQQVGGLHSLAAGTAPQSVSLSGNFGQASVQALQLTFPNGTGAGDLFLNSITLDGTTYHTANNAPIQMPAQGTEDILLASGRAFAMLDPGQQSTALPSGLFHTS